MALIDDDESTSSEPEDEPDVPTQPHDPKTMVLVPDLRSLAFLPADPDDALQTFRAIQLPRGKTLHVPNEPGCYVTLGPWEMIVALSKVHFAASTKRSPELLLSFADFTTLSDGKRKGIYAVTLALPLQKSHRVYEDSLLFTSIDDVIGFSEIPWRTLPWSALRLPVLQRQPIYHQMEIYSQADIITSLRTPFQTRLELMAKIATKSIETACEAIHRQDPRAAGRQKALMLSRLCSVVTFFKESNPKKYDKRTSDRISVLDPAAEDCTWLKTPQRKSLLDADAEVCQTAMAVRVNASPIPQPNIEGAAEEPAAAGDEAEVPVVPLTEDQVDDMLFGSDVEVLEEVEAVEVGATAGQVEGGPKELPQRNKSQRARKSVDRLDSGQQEVVKKSRRETAQEKAAAKKEAGINPHTGLPYKRVPGGYTKGTAASAIKQLEKDKKAAAAKEKKADEEASKESKRNAKVLADAVEITYLKGEITRLTALNTAQEQLHAMALLRCQLEAAQGQDAKLLHRYRDGLRDGSKLTLRNAAMEDLTPTDGDSTPVA